MKEGHIPADAVQSAVPAMRRRRYIGLQAFDGANTESRRMGMVQYFRHHGVGRNVAAAREDFASEYLERLHRQGRPSVTQAAFDWMVDKALWTWKFTDFEEDRRPAWPWQDKWVQVRDCSGPKSSRYAEYLRRNPLPASASAPAAPTPSSATAPRKRPRMGTGSGSDGDGEAARAPVESELKTIFLRLAEACSDIQIMPPSADRFNADTIAGELAKPLLNDTWRDNFMDFYQHGQVGRWFCDVEVFQSGREAKTAIDPAVGCRMHEEDACLLIMVRGYGPDRRLDFKAT